MKQQRMIYYASGENSGTYSFLCFSENFTGDLTETCEKFISWDFNMYKTVQKYRECTVEIPDWMTENLWKHYEIDWKYTIGLTGLDPQTMTRTRFDRLRQLGEKYKYFIGWVLQKKTNNAFMKSIQDQIINWLDAEETKHSTPLSPRQWDAATQYCPLYKAKQIATTLYYQR